jgi:hypothetical protein
MNVKCKSDQTTSDKSQIAGAKRKSENLEEGERKKKQALPLVEKDVIESEHSASDSEDDVGVAYKDIVRVSLPVLTPPNLEKPSLFQLQSLERLRAASSAEEYLAMHREATENVALKEYDTLTYQQKLDLWKEIKEADESGLFVPRKPKSQS